jgi:hypothetical protein
LVYLSALLFPNSYIILFWGILFSFILCASPNQHNLFNLIVSVIVFFFFFSYISLLVTIFQFSFSLSYTGLKFFYTQKVRRLWNLIFQKKSIANIFQNNSPWREILEVIQNPPLHVFQTSWQQDLWMLRKEHLSVIGLTLWKTGLTNLLIPTEK